MSAQQAGESNEASDALRAELVYGFGDYHTRIATQVALVDLLVAAVRREERERCVRIAERFDRERWPTKFERRGTDLAQAIRSGQSN